VKTETSSSVAWPKYGDLSGPWFSWICMCVYTYVYNIYILYIYIHISRGLFDWLSAFFSCCFKWYLPGNYKKNKILAARSYIMRSTRTSRKTQRSTTESVSRSGDHASIRGEENCGRQDLFGNISHEYPQVTLSGISFAIVRFPIFRMMFSQHFP